MIRQSAFGIALVLMSLCVGCQSGPAKFASPEQAFDSLNGALAQSPDAALKILGPDAQQIMHSGDPVADRSMAKRVAERYREQHTLTTNADGSMTALIGPKQWPMPIPCVKTPDGKWQFDASAGKEEVLDRRIGRNELAAIQVCLAIADAEQDYVDARPMGGVPCYAGRFLSTPGKKDGLYWPTTQPTDPQSPLGDLVAQAADEGYPTTKPLHGERPAYHGYRYRMLEAQGDHAEGGAWNYVYNGKQLGGFAVLAYPAEYGNSGVMSFIINQTGTVYQKDLGKDTATVAEQIDSYDPAPGWTLVHTEATTEPQ